MRNLFLLIFMFLVSVSFVAGASRTWDGDANDNNWQTPQNWSADIAPKAGDDLIFPATATKFSSNNDFPASTNFNSITIEGGNYIFSGNSLTLNEEFKNNSGNNQINFALILNSHVIFTIAAESALSVSQIKFENGGLTTLGEGEILLNLIKGAGGITQSGLGTTRIFAAENFTGNFILNRGTVIVNAEIPESFFLIGSGSPPNGNNNGTLGGSGTVRHSYTLTGTITPGSNPGETAVFNVKQDLILGRNADYVCEIGGVDPGAGGYDQIIVEDFVGLNNAPLNLKNINGFRPSPGDSFIIIKNLGDSEISSNFKDAPEGALVFDQLKNAYKISYRGGDGNDVELTSINRARFDFDGDGRSDISQFEPESGIWTILQSSNANTLLQQFGTESDKLAPADFDGDNKTDFAVFRPENGTWFILNSNDSTVDIRQFGQAGDIPVAADYDGDGLADIAVFRPADGVWFQLRSQSQEFFAAQFGQNGDLPQIGDFDGDGKSDLAVYRPADGTWFYLRSSDNSFTAFPFGIATDVPVAADFDGDGLTDAAVFRATDDPVQPDFYILRSSDLNFQGVSWGIPGDLPVVADYDGDGVADIGIFRPSTNDWFLLNSSEGFSNVSFGQNGDLPIPSASTSQ